MSFRQQPTAKCFFFLFFLLFFFNIALSFVMPLLSVDHLHSGTITRLKFWRSLSYACLLIFTESCGALTLYNSPLNCPLIVLHPVKHWEISHGLLMLLLEWIQTRSRYFMGSRLHWIPHCKEMGFLDMRLSLLLLLPLPPLHCKLLAAGRGLRHWAAEELKWALLEQPHWAQGPRTKGVCVRLCVFSYVFVHTPVSDWSMYMESILLTRVQGSQAVDALALLQACTVRTKTWVHSIYIHTASLLHPQF